MMKSNRGIPLIMEVRMKAIVESNRGIPLIMEVRMRVRDFSDDSLNKNIPRKKKLSCIKQKRIRH